MRNSKAPLLALLLAIILISGCIDHSYRPGNNASANNTTGPERGSWLIWWIPWGSDSWRYDSAPDYDFEEPASYGTSSGGREEGEDAEPTVPYGDFYQTEDSASGETSYGDFYSSDGVEASGESQSYGDFYSGDAGQSGSEDADWWSFGDSVSSDSSDSGWWGSGDSGGSDSDDSGWGDSGDSGGWDWSDSGGSDWSDSGDFGDSDSGDW